MKSIKSLSLARECSTCRIFIPIVYIYICIWSLRLNINNPRPIFESTFLCDYKIKVIYLFDIFDFFGPMNEIILYTLFLGFKL